MNGNPQSLALHDDRNMANNIQQRLLDTYTVQSCMNCDNCDKDKGICKLCNMQPPMKVVVMGCDKWLCDIPF